MLRCLLILLIASSGIASADSALKPFESDGCTFFMEGPPKYPNLWADCCFEHDLRYWFGGTLKNRDSTDLYLRQCVRDKAGPSWSELIYKAVVWGHRSPIKHRYSWGWGWDPKKENSDLTRDEVLLVEERLSNMNLDPAFLEEFKKRYIDPLKTP